MKPDHRKVSRLLLLGAVAAMMFPACVGASAKSPGAPVDVTLRDFGITTADPIVSGSNVAFHIHNASPSTHEFVLIRSDLPSDQLPIASNGLSVDEEQIHSVGEISKIDSESTQTLALHLAPGHYVFFCNLEGHYLGGMHGTLEVSDDATA
jgi:uncharacterized cupredoxin-like copper-binding protein